MTQTEREYEDAVCRGARRLGEISAELPYTWIEDCFNFDSEKFRAISLGILQQPSMQWYLDQLGDA